MTSNRKIICYIASSLDGFIAKPNDDLSFLQMVEKPGEDYGYTSFVAGIDTVILGRKTYDWVMKQVPEFPHADKETFVITRQPQPAIGKTTFYSGNLAALIASLQADPGKDIFIDGGSELIHSLLQLKLIDEFIISVIPVILGAGTRLFREGFPEQALTLVSVKPFEKGLVQLHYSKNRVD